MLYKLIYLTLISCALFFSTACQDDDSFTEGIAENSFDIDGQNYDTYSGALLVDRGPEFSNRFSFIFQNGRISSTPDSGFVIETVATNVVRLNVEMSNDVFDDWSDITFAPGNFVLTPDSKALFDIVDYVTVNASFGTPVESTANRVEVGTNGNGSMTIFVIDVDEERGEVTVELAYNITTDDVLLSGKYFGRLCIMEVL